MAHKLLGILGHSLLQLVELVVVEVVVVVVVVVGVVVVVVVEVVVVGQLGLVGLGRTMSGRMLASCKVQLVVALQLRMGKGGFDPIHRT
jgi:hypothetical protein